MTEFNFTPRMLERMLQNPILDVDSYKASQWCQYPAFLEFLESYIESRGGKYKYTVVVGIQRFVKEYLSRPITQQDIDDAEIFWKLHGEPFNKEGWQYILDVHKGYIPVRILSVREGTVVPVHNVIAKAKSTDPKCAWVESYIETALLRAIWYPTTVATVSHSIKQVIKKFMLKSCDNLDGLPFKLHDFGARGVSSKESAGIGGMAHLVNFMGSDNVTGVLYSMYYYNHPTMTAFSVPAAEHSTITSWLRKRERDAYANMLEQFGGKYANISVVSDSYDIYKAVDIWGEFKEDIIKCGSMLVIRPDSGEAKSVVIKLLLKLDAKFGHTMNAKGFRVLKNVRILWGDGIDEESIIDILTAMMGYNFSVENILFGMGGALLQKVDRDTQKFAMKASAAIVAGQEIEVYKDPITDQGKQSKRGRQMLYKDSEGVFYTDKEGNDSIEYLHSISDTGKLLFDDNFADIRIRSEDIPKELHEV
jgi:nicotinamide phosphoribosyltransferase